MTALRVNGYAPSPSGIPPAPFFSSPVVALTAVPAIPVDERPVVDERVAFAALTPWSLRVKKDPPARVRAEKNADRYFARSSIPDDLLPRLQYIAKECETDETCKEYYARQGRYKAEAPRKHTVGDLKRNGFEDEAIFRAYLGHQIESSIEVQIVPGRSQGPWITQEAAKLRRTDLYKEIALSTPTAVKAGKTVISAAQSKTLQLFLKILGKENVGGSWASHPDFLYATGLGRIFGGNVAGIAAIVDLVTQIIELKDEIRKGRKAEGAIAGLQILEAISSIGDSIAVTAMGLESVGAIALNSVLWASPLSIVCAFTSLVTIPVHMLNIHKAKSIVSQLDGFLKPEGDSSKTSLQWLSQELTDENRDGECYMSRHFGLFDRERSGARVQHIIKEGSEVQQGKLATALKDRLNIKISNHKLAILSAVVGIIGVAIIFFAAPVVGGIFSIGFAIIAVSGLLSFVRFLREKQSVNQLEKKLEELCDFDAIPDAWLEANFPAGMDARMKARPGYYAHQTFEAPLAPLNFEQRASEKPIPDAMSRDVVKPKNKPKPKKQPREPRAIEMDDFRTMPTRAARV